MSRLPLLALLCGALSLPLACGGEEAAPAPPAAPTAPEPAPAASAAAPVEPPPPSVLADAPAGFEPIELSADDPCEGPVVWVGPDTVTPAVEPGQEPPLGYESIPPGVGREVWLAMWADPLVMLRSMTGAFHGPGGEPLFRQHLQGTDARPILFFDRRVPRERLLAALGGARDGLPFRVGGHQDGRRRCAIALGAVPDELPRELVYDARVDEGGQLQVRGRDAAEAAVHAGQPFAGEPDESLHVLGVATSAGADASTLIRALAAARLGDRRYGFLIH